LEFTGFQGEIVLTEKEVFSMGSLGKILGVLLIVASLATAGVGAFLMLYYAPMSAEESTFPTDFDEHNLYGGFLDRLNTSTGQIEHVDFTIDRRIEAKRDLGGGKLELEETIVGVENGTEIEVPELTKHNILNIDEKSINLYLFEDKLTGAKVEYTKDDDIQWIFPHPVDKDEDYNVFNMNILDYSGAVYIGKEDRFGVECYIFRGEEVEYEVPIPPSTAQKLGSLAEGSTMKLTLWEKAWVHPLTGSIIDYAKEINTYLYLPELPAIPEIRYPSDLNSTTIFEGDLVLFDQASASFMTYEGINARRYLETVSESGYNLTIEEMLNVTTSDGASIPLLDSQIEVVIDARNGMHVGQGRSGHYLFSPQGAEMMNYSIWDDGYGMELNAEYIGQETESFGGLTANIYHIYVENETYLPGGFATLNMTYWVEENTGIVLDVTKEQILWKPQNARRLPLETDDINKTVTLNTTITSINPLTMEEIPMDIHVEQVINCTGYTNSTFGVAKITETVTKYLSNGTPMGGAAVSSFGVDAYTMDYVDVDDWSTVDRDGQFTFPIGLLNDTGEVTPVFRMFNSDLGMSFDITLENEMMENGLSLAVYEMNLSGIPLTYAQVVGILGQDPGLPGATGLYNCLYEYHVDIDTGTLVDIVRMVTIDLVPPTYDFLWDNLDSVSIVKGEVMGENVTMTQTIIGTDAGEGLTLMNYTKTYKYDNGSDFQEAETSEVLINTSSHEMLHPNGTGMGLYFLFPASPTAPAYPMAYQFGGTTFIGAAVRGAETDTAVAYNFSETLMVDLGIFGMPGVNANMTLDYNYLVNSFTGMVLDVNVMILLENNSINMTTNMEFLSMDDPLDTAMKNTVMAWAIMGDEKRVLDISMELYDMEAQAAVMKAKATMSLLDIADGDKAAMVLSLALDSATKAGLIETASGKVSDLQDLASLVGAYQLNGLLDSRDNLVLYVYYKKVDEDKDLNEFEDLDGSVKYWADIAKDKDDEYEKFATTIPTILYILAGVGIIIGLVLILAPGRKTEEAEE
jgi:hypothetical protein